jgi:hypothetical protein
MLLTRRKLKQLKKVLRANIKDFKSLPNATVTDTKDGPMIHIDNGSNVLAIAHMDTVMDTKDFFITDQKGPNPTVHDCPQLDDRLGVWVLLYLLPHLDPNFKYDILLTDSEEVGQSTAKDFVTDKQYNYIFEFDRAGTDVVTYDYSSGYWDAQMEKISHVGHGSFSDISYAQHLGCKGVNIGVGYYGQHTKKCYAKLNETVDMAQKFLNWANKVDGTLFSHTEVDSYQSYDAYYHTNFQQDKLSWDGYDGNSDNGDSPDNDYCNTMEKCLSCGVATTQNYLCSTCQLDHYQAMNPADSRSWSKRYCS